MIAYCIRCGKAYPSTPEANETDECPQCKRQWLIVLGGFVCLMLAVWVESCP